VEAALCNGKDGARRGSCMLAESAFADFLGGGKRMY